MNRLGASTDNRYAGILEPLRQSKWGLPTQLYDHANYRACLLLRVHNLQNIFEGQRLEIQAVRSVVVGGDGLGIAIDHDGFVTRIA